MQYAERLTRAEQMLDYEFRDRELLLLALTHPSASEGNRQSAMGSYERLEFLGDAILGAIISRELYDRYPNLDEGALTRLKVSAVAGQTLARLAGELGLEKLVVFGSSERGTGKRGLQSALENVYEALVAALAIDGGTEAAERFVLRTLAPMINTRAAREPENPKSMLQEMLQAEGVTPTYEIIDTDGPPHNRQFTARVLADEQALAAGSGHSKKDAEMQAATRALESLKAGERATDRRATEAGESDAAARDETNLAHNDRPASAEKR
ncbi:MAG: ribonuclease III [Coriobacteriales bacterium]|nr:ribonuclease III [Coriobacteriales bacterium]